MPKTRYVSPDQIAMFPDDHPPRRLFIGLMPDVEVQTAIARQRRGWQFADAVVPVRLQRLHLTLHFLEQVEHSRALDLQQALAEVRMEAVALTLRTPELWAPSQVAVVRPDASEALDDLRERLARPLRRLGLPTAAEWTPHLTLAHEANGAVPPADAAPVPWVASDFALVWSHRQPTAQYELLARYPAVGSGG